VGSSASTQRGSVTSALALAAGKLARQVRDAPAQAHALEDRARAALRLGGALAADHQRHRDVLECAEFGQQVVELVDEAQGAVAHAPALRLGQRHERSALDRHLARARRVEPAEEVQQRALARARRADDRDALARRHVQVDAEQHRHVLRAAAVGLLQAPAGEDGGRRRLTHSAAPPRD
jgi:hypothetical protein